MGSTYFGVDLCALFPAWESRLSFCNLRLTLRGFLKRDAAIGGEEVITGTLLSGRCYAQGGFDTSNFVLFEITALFPFIWLTFLELG